MSVLVVYESVFGNTKTVAEEIAAGLAPADVILVGVDEAPREIGDGVDLLVLGGPTHAFSMSRPKTRQDAVSRSSAPVAANKIGIREWLADLPAPRPGVRAATFDTRTRRPRLPGSAARAAARRLRSRGLDRLIRPQTFWVRGTQGPLHDGEKERARAWGAALLSHLDADARVQ